ncbi:hypothetical protein B4099_2647 [Heyndrickxia coagulans]|uniref:Uncharacterized protein n=1 Tax=Heyndrickxia coagulans TaxID=1398 RepID=A0A150JPK9_HEYCO|nr:hypothetical protein B4099_2647 [Heyndrickxia coagulans]
MKPLFNVPAGPAVFKCRQLSKKPAAVQKISAGFFYFGCGKNLPQNESKNLVCVKFYSKGR